MFNKLRQIYFRYKAKRMMQRTGDSLMLYHPTKTREQWKVAFLTTAGVHLKDQPIFDVEAGDYTIRKIPGKASMEELTISHTHYDTTAADEDKNVVFPLDILRDLAVEGEIAAVAETHYGMMGYIPNTTGLVLESIPEIIQQLKAEQVDVLLLSPG